MTATDTRTRLAIHLLTDLGITDQVRDNPQAIWDRLDQLDRDHYLRRADDILAVIDHEPNDIETTGQCCCAGCIGMGPCDLDLGQDDDADWDDDGCRYCGDPDCDGGCDDEWDDVPMVPPRPVTTVDPGRYL